MAVSIDFSLLHKLERFRIVPRGTYRGGTIGNRRSTSRGTGLEFADHKGYSAGDDIRYLDWNVYGRLEELFIKKFEQEEALPVYVLIDSSGSMLLGDTQKYEFGARLALALSYVGLANNDNVRAIRFGEGLLSSTKGLTGKTGIYEIINFLNSSPKGKTDITKALQDFLAENRSPGVVFVISDFLDPQGIMEGIRLLTGRKYGVYGMHLIAPEEVAPEVSEDMELLDSETGKLLKVSVRRTMKERYGKFFLEHCAGIEKDLTHYGVRYMKLLTNASSNEVIFNLFTKEGVLK